MENRFKLRISRVLRSSFGSCRSRNITDIIGKPVFVPENQKLDVMNVIEPVLSPPPKPRPFPSMTCKPRCPETTKEKLIHHSCITRRQKVSEKYSLFYSVGDHSGRTCPPASPMSPSMSTYYDKFYEFQPEKKGKRRRSKRKQTRKKRETFLFSSEEEREEETETLFSSKSTTFSSDSSNSHRKMYGTRRKRVPSKNSEVGVLPLKGDGKVKDSFAVVKRSSDPYGDFRTSMVEMIVERQIFSAKDLEQLLQCFLTLNSHHHHKVIVEVFMEIWEALFSNWS